jgi:glycerol-3-phosphate dehydrogenase
MEDPAAGKSIRLSKGVHVLLDADHDWSAALTVPHDKVRVSFAVPWEGMLLLGTTDALHEGDPDGVAVEPEDVDQVLAEAAVAVDPAVIRADRVRSVYAGLRALPGGSKATTRAHRETVLTRGKCGMLSVAGGKLTTYRRIALDALAELRPDLGLHRIDPSPWPLPGARDLDRIRLPIEISPELRSHLQGLYGSLSPEVLSAAVDDPGLLEPITPDAPDIAAQVVYAASHEWAQTVEDVVRRRMTLALRGSVGPAEREKVEELIGIDKHFASSPA